MKKLLVIPLLIVTSFFTNIAIAEEMIGIPEGRIVIEGTKVDFIDRYGRVSHIPVATDTMTVSIKEKFPMLGRTVIVFEENNGGVACPATYFIYKIALDSRTQTSPSFGTCSDLLKIKQYRDKLVMTMPSMAHKGIDNYVYRFSDGILTENNKVLNNLKSRDLEIKRIGE